MNGAVNPYALEPWPRIGRASLLVGIAGLGVAALTGFGNRLQFFHAYLVAYLFWMSLALGSLGILMVQHLTGGAWGLAIRRPLEAAAITIPILVILFVPLLFGLPDLYAWTNPAIVAKDPLLAHKRAYLNVPFFAGRAAVYFAVWGGLAWLLGTWSRGQDATGDPLLTRRMERLSGPGLILLGLTLSFAGVDWVMSLEPKWFSTIWGLYFLGGPALASLALVIGVVTLAGDRPPLADLVTPELDRDLGNLLLMWVMLWAYFAFSQYLLVWAGNLPEEIPWYLHRLRGSWFWIAILLIVAHFAVPFFLLLNRTVKDYPRRLAGVALALVVMHYVDVYWMVMPHLHPESARPRFIDLLAMVGVGGLWVSAYLWRLGQHALIPLRDPYLAEAFGRDRH